MVFFIVIWLYTRKNIVPDKVILFWNLENTYDKIVRTNFDHDSPKINTNKLHIL